ncbi:MAG: CBS domain-containing protein, partial [Bacteroidales bacterium]|nr:CBS domain-containing protein [Bacteroidales bacterium]
TDISAVLKTFERYNYEVKATFTSDKETELFYEDRFEEFMKYLSI